MRQTMATVTKLVHELGLDREITIGLPENAPEVVPGMVVTVSWDEWATGGPKTLSEATEGKGDTS